jgi:hypothetical protein
MHSHAIFSWYCRVIQFWQTCRLFSKLRFCTFVVALDSVRVCARVRVRARVWGHIVVSDLSVAVAVWVWVCSYLDVCVCVVCVCVCVHTHWFNLFVCSTSALCACHDLRTSRQNHQRFHLQTPWICEFLFLSLSHSLSPTLSLSLSIYLYSWVPHCSPPLLFVCSRMLLFSWRMLLLACSHFRLSSCFIHVRVCAVCVFSRVISNM